MSIKTFTFAAFAVAIALIHTTAAAQQGGNPALGKQTYEMFCAVCHGPTGEGSPLGQSLISVDAKLNSDNDILETITDGKPGTAMSAYGSGLSRDEIFWTMIYIRELQGDQRVRGNAIEELDLPVRPIISDEARQGEALFNGKAGCIECHSYYTRGGILASDLSKIASMMSPEEIRANVLQPNANLNPNYGTKELALTDGTRIQGRFRMETLNSIQISNEDATLWRTYFKKDIARMRDGKRSLMPDDYGTRLTEAEQEQLFAFLATLK